MSNDDFHTYESLFDLVSEGEWTAAYYLCVRYIVAACITGMGISLVCCGGCSIFIVVWKSITLTCWFVTCGRCCGGSGGDDRASKKEKKADDSEDESEGDDDDDDAVAIERDLMILQAIENVDKRKQMTS